MLTNIKLHLN